MSDIKESERAELHKTIWRIANDLRAFLTANGFHDASVEPLTPTVEDSFIARTEDAA